MSNRIPAALLLLVAPLLPAAENGPLLARIRERGLAALESLPNYVCIDSVERSRRFRGDHAFRLLDGVRVELAHVDGVDRFSRVGEGSHSDRSAEYGLSFKGDFADNRALIFKNPWTTIRAAGQETLDKRPTWKFEYEVPVEHGGLSANVDGISNRIPTRGAFWADQETLDVVRIDVEGYDIPPELRLRSIGARTIYWRVLGLGPIDGVLLARNSEFILTESDGTIRRNQSAFTSCREYQARSRIFYGSEGSAAGPSAPELPGNVELKLTLDTAIDPGKASVGDPIRAHVAESSGTIHKGADVTGHITRIIRSPGEVQIGLEFSDLEYRSTRVPFTARLIGLHNAPKIRSFGYIEDGPFVRYDPPGTATLYIAANDPLLHKGLITYWLTEGTDH
ncbi:MAG TPA: hypothetical protein VGL53_08605 [Bryobacteraceae bacterium]|jgi:hypothetical protein